MLRDVWSDLRYRLRALFRRADLERDLDDELAFHLARETEKLVRAGVEPGEARRRARLAFGGQVDRFKEESRDARGVAWLDILTRDLAYAVRGLRASPGFTLAVVGTLALGLGANAAMFGIVDQLLFRPPAMLRDPGRVHRVYLYSTYRDRTEATANFSYTTYRNLTRWTSSFDATAAVFQTPEAVGLDEETSEMPVGAVSASFFDFFDAPPVLGRYFGPAEDSVPEGTAVAVLGHAYWASRYGSRPDVLGTTVQVGALAYTIIGVAPPGFAGSQGGAPPALYIPITSYAYHVEWAADDPTEYYTTYHWGWMEMLVRRKAGLSVERATADLSQAYQRDYAVQRETDPGLPPAAIARPHALAGPLLAERGPNQATTTRVAGWVAGVALIVLLIACANVANLLLARALARRREIGLRLALGVSRPRLFAQLLTESVLLAGLGGLAGLAVAYWGGDVLRSMFLPGAGPGAGSVATPRILALAGLAAVAAGVMTGLAPILMARRVSVTDSLKLGAREGTYQRSRARSALLLVQGALSVLLLIGAGLFVRSLDQVRSLRLGYDADRVLYVRLELRGNRLGEAERAELARRLVEAARTVPGVQNASRLLTIPFWRSRSVDLYVAGIDSVGRLGHFGMQTGSPEFFETMGTRILRGRGFSAGDRANAPGVMVVSEAMAGVLWPGQDPIGRCVRVGADSLPCRTVVGVAENIKNRSLTDEVGYFYYLPADQYMPEAADLAVRTRGRAPDLAETVRKALQPLMPGTSYLTATPLQRIVDPRLRSWELGATMFAAFGGLALLLAGVGLYSVIAYNVTQRTHELGLRIALGATLRDVLRLVVGEGIRFAVLGVAIGGLIALSVGPRIGPLLYAQRPNDPAVFAGVAAVLILVATAASVIPALRAARVDPTVALRAD